jgi:hypothetical protein
LYGYCEDIEGRKEGRRKTTMIQVPRREEGSVMVVMVVAVVSHTGNRVNPK